MLLGFGTKLKLNLQQRKLMAQHAGYSRWVYNWGLATLIKLYLDGIKIKTTELKKFYTNHVKPDYPWQSTLSSRVYQFAFRDLDRAFSRFFQGLGKFPRFKKKGRNDSFTIDAGGKLIPIGGTRIKLPFIGWVNTFEGCPQTAVKKVTISRKAGDWYIAIAFEQTRPKPPLKIVDRFYPSSKTCSNCQDIKQDLTLSDRWFICNNCGVFLPRDWNASINLASYADGLSVKACGVVNADVATMKQEVKSV